MKQLFLANRIPYPPYRGDKLKIYHLAKRLAKRHELHLLTFTEKESDLQYLPELQAIFKEVRLVHLPKWQSALHCATALWDSRPLQVLYFQSGKLQKELNEMLQLHRYDAIHVQHLRMSPYLEHRQDIPRILDLPDAFSLYWSRRKEVPRGVLTRWFETLEQKRVYKYENSILKRYDLVLACSGEDIGYLKKEHGSDNLQLLPNGVDLDAFKADHHDYAHNRTLLFTGNMDYAPNVDAVVHFTHNILPKIHERFPQTRFVIAGQRPITAVKELAGENVEVTGFIKDLAAVYNSASVVVAPLRFGAGTQNKVLESMAMGVPVVCSNIGFAGLGIESGEGAIMKTDAGEFAGAVMDLLASEEFRQSVGEQGKAIVRSRFGWDAVAGQLEQYFRQISGA